MEGVWAGEWEGIPLELSTPLTRQWGPRQLQGAEEEEKVPERIQNAR